MSNRLLKSGCVVASTITFALALGCSSEPGNEQNQISEMNPESQGGVAGAGAMAPAPMGGSEPSTPDGQPDVEVPGSPAPDTPQGGDDPASPGSTPEQPVDGAGGSPATGAGGSGTAGMDDAAGQGGTPATGGQPGTAGTGGAATTPDNSEYPAGPYGENIPEVGDVLEDLPLRGLLNLEANADSDGLAVADTSLAKVRASGKPLALLITAAGWCPSCRTAARELGNELATQVEMLNEQGGLVAHLLLDGGSTGTRPTDNEIVNWAKAASLKISVFGGQDERVRAVFPEREFAFIVDLNTMEVLWSQRVELYVKPTVSTVGTEKLAEFLNK